jgi:phosphatidylglycerophosphate synthase
MKAGIRLHRAGKKADWAKVSRRRWNMWQQLAGNSAGVLTLGNTLTVAGFCLVIWGLAMAISEMYWSAFVFIGAGRICDLLDGWLADRTKTKSPLGELLDSTADKLETAIALAVLTFTGLLPLPAAGLIFLPQSAIALLAFARWLQGRRLQPTRPGKVGMAVVWLGLGLFILAAATDWMPALVVVLAYICCAISAILAVAVLSGYSRPKS